MWRSLEAAMRFLALLLLATVGVAGACPALAEVVILRGSSAPPAPSPPPPPVEATTVQREVVYVPIYNPPIYFVTLPVQAVRPLAPAHR
jgi:hypothetical protein